MQNVINFPQGATRASSFWSNSAPAARPTRQRVVASVVLRPTPECGKNLPSRGICEGHYIGTLTCRGFTIELDDGNPLGLVAFALGAKSIKLNTPSFPDRTFTLRYGQLPPEYYELEKQADAARGRKRKAIREEILFAARASIAIDQCRGAKRASKDDYAYWQKLLDKAVKRLPPHLRHIVELEKAAGYDTKGNALSADRFAQWSALRQATEARKG